MSSIDPIDLISALDALSDADETAPPQGLREAALDAALRARPIGASLDAPEAAAPLEAFLDQVAALRATVEGLTPEQWALRVDPYEWTVHDLIGHLVGIESYIGGLLGLFEFENVTTDDDHLELAGPTIARYRDRDSAEVVQAWLDLTVRIADHLGTLDEDRLAEEIGLYGYPFSVGAAVVAHAFELWTHADDVRRTLGAPVESPNPRVLRAMSEVSVHSLFPATVVTAPHQFERSAKIVLTGPGGGMWQLGEASAEPDVVVVADVVDYCRMIARRLDPEALVADIEGDRVLALDLFVAGRLFAA